MIRKDAIEICVNQIGNQPIISANGFISRDLYNVGDSNLNFYMIGSMGLASSIGLGVAIKTPKKRIFVFDGDGNILMNLGSLVTIGSIFPNNLIHIIFDNSIHESTGGQPTATNIIQIEKIARACNYNYVFKVSTKNQIIKIFNKLKRLKGPIMIVVKIEKGKSIGKRISKKPVDIQKKFSQNL